MRFVIYCLGMALVVTWLSSCRVEGDKVEDYDIDQPRDPKVGMIVEARETLDYWQFDGEGWRWCAPGGPQWLDKDEVRCVYEPVDFER